MRHPHLWMGLLLWSVFGQAQAAWTVNMAPGATEVSHAVFNLHMTIFWICVVTVSYTHLTLPTIILV